MPFFDRVVGSSGIYVEPRNRPVRLIERLSGQGNLRPRKGQSFKDWQRGINVATQPTGIRTPGNWPLEDRTERSRMLRAKSPIAMQNARPLVREIVKRFRVSIFRLEWAPFGQKVRSRRFR